MSLMLIRRGIEALVGTALVVVTMVAVLPTVAEAQSITTTQEAARVVVEPGDSLWSISAEMLGAGATLAQIDRKVERIYALNRDQIGPDPNLIFPGQVLSVAPVGERSRAQQQAAADRSGEPVVSESASKKGVTVAALKPTPKKEAAKGSAQVRLTPSRDSGVSGTATLTDVGGAVKIELNMRGLPEAGVEHISHIHGGGTCADDRADRTAPETIPLKTVVAKGDGTGSATTTIRNVTLDKLFGGNQARFILVHAKTKEGQGIPPGISCADLRERTGNGGLETQPASGGFSLPALPAAKKVVPKVGSLSETNAPSPTNGSPVEPFLRDARSVVASAASELRETFTEVRAAAVEAPRATLGWVIVVLTVLVGVLMAWRLPMKRTTRRDAERWEWGIPTGYYGGGSHPSYSVNLSVPTAKKPDEYTEQPPHESPALEAPVASGPTTNNGSKANGSGAKLAAAVVAAAVDSHALRSGGVITRAPQVKRRQLSRRAAAARGSGQTVVRKGLVSGLNSAEIHHAAPRILPNRRRRRQRKPPNGGIQAARRRVGGRW